jgi:hypothetical protein
LGECYRNPIHLAESIFAISFPSLPTVQVYQLPVPVVGVTVGLAAGAVGVEVAPVVGTTVGLVVGAAVVVGVGAPAAGVVSTPVAWLLPVVWLLPVAWLLFWFCVSVLPALKVALMATPFPSVVTATGSGVFNKPTQFSPLAP